jgi:ADP-ribose pyrophosphatase YjhB (NUDIX family)
MRAGEFYSAVFVIIENEKREILFQKRQNTWFADWLYQLPAGHLEWEELFKEALIRELKEELDIDVLEEDLDLLHIQHRIRKWMRVYFDIYLKVNKISWEIKNNEPEKCSELKFINIDNCNKEDFIWFDVEVIKLIKSGKQISEYIH